MPKKRTSRVYTRNQGAAARFYIDLRDLGGPQRKALVAPGEKRATTDPDVAAVLGAAEVQRLEDRKRRKVMVGVEEDALLGPFPSLPTYVRHGARKELE